MKLDGAYQIGFGGPIAIPHEPPPAPRLDPLGSVTTLHHYAPNTGVPCQGLLFSLFRRTDVYTVEHVANVQLLGDGMRADRVLEAVCRALDDELATRQEIR